MSIEKEVVEKMVEDFVKNMDLSVYEKYIEAAVRSYFRSEEFKDFVYEAMTEQMPDIITKKLVQAIKKNLVVKIEVQ